ncbi:chaplin family protein [Marinactinospora thermotolerans]|uniref:Small secreted domain n=1 Tax=Marinactinospora thermotolerans DSM 45154 TaxID=1122192 RepID=A0A1T4T2B7_9ACTN|nr:chaplin [Marinactinospora thermotolerans]SKA34391.1 Small secreted domain [Marinactinospora thermotolerans DSM 45154]
MRKKLYTSASAALLAAGLTGAFAPHAAADQLTDGTGGVVAGNQVSVPADIKANLCGNSLAVLGISEAECTQVAKVLYAASGKGQASQQTDGSGGIASGNQINIPVDAAIEVCGNSVAVGGISEAECTKIVEKVADSQENEQRTSGAGGIASGNQINVPVDVAVNICGNSIGVLGISKAECNTVINVIHEAPENKAGGQQTDGSGGIASGNQVTVPVDAAVEICGNAVSVLGLGEAECVSEISDEQKPPAEDPKPGDDCKGKDEHGYDTDCEERPGGDKPGGEEPGGERPGEGKPEEPGGSEGPGTPGGPGDTEGQSGPGGSDGTSADESATPGGLPVTGAALGGLVAAAVAAVGGGGAAMYLARRRKAAAAAGEE